MDAVSVLCYSMGQSFTWLFVYVRGTIATIVDIVKLEQQEQGNPGVDLNEIKS